MMCAGAETESGDADGWEVAVVSVLFEHLRVCVGEADGSNAPAECLVSSGLSKKP